MTEATNALDGLDPALSAPKRLAAMALLSRASFADFPFLRTQLGVSDSDLSKQMAALEALGYVTISKSGRGRGSVTTFAITKAGRRAYDVHRAALERLLSGE
ncbi:transcriptional regulator [Aeromicrobium sp.]|uniref:transcriptional regulator n=1 Tax=Aeromicrobium sp. TaxID=1871063 RepID=UPI003519D271